MKEQILISPKYLVLMVGLFVTVIAIAFLFFRENYLKHNKEIKTLITKEIKGVIVNLKNENRGSYYIEIKTEQEDFKIHSLPIAWEIKEYNIQIGDSVSKEANSKIMTFYKNKKKCCEYEF